MDESKTSVLDSLAQGKIYQYTRYMHKTADSKPTSTIIGDCESDYSHGNCQIQVWSILACRFMELLSIKMKAVEAR
jgi:hypothetical protein